MSKERVVTKSKHKLLENLYLHNKNELLNLSGVFRVMSEKLYSLASCTYA